MLRRSLREHLAPVLIDAHFRKPLLERLDPAEVDVGDCDELKRRMFRERRDVRQRLARCADARMSKHRRGGARAWA